MNENKDSLNLPILLFGALLSCILYLAVVSIELTNKGVAMKQSNQDTSNIYRADNADSPDTGDDPTDN